MINYEKILEIYGKDTLISILDNKEDIEKNLNYLNRLEFKDIIDMFERYPKVFIQDNKYFKIKLNKLITRLGVDYVTIIENNLDLMEELE